MVCTCFFFNDTATTEIYTLSLHDALPIFQEGRRVPRHQPRGRRLLARDDRSEGDAGRGLGRGARAAACREGRRRGLRALQRSEEHTSELQSRQYLVCRLLLEKKKTIHSPI